MLVQEETIKLRKQLEEKDKQLEEKDKQLEEKDKQIATLQASQNVQDIPQLVDDKIGPIKVQNLSRISEDDRRRFQALARRFREEIRRKLTSEGRASIKFHVIGKDRTTNIESLVPISFIVDLKERTTDMILDESRL
jgi:hypothetical protein